MPKRKFGPYRQATEAEKAYLRAETTRIHDAFRKLRARLNAAAATGTFTDLSDLTDDEFRARLRALKADAGMVRKGDGAVKPLLEVVDLDFIERLAAMKYQPDRGDDD